MAAFLAVGLGAAAYFSFVRGSAGSGPAPSPSTDIHSKEAVMAAVRHYYEVEDRARATGSLDLILPATSGPGTPAYENFKAFLLDQTAKGRRSVTTYDQINAWRITLGDQSAIAFYTLVQRGHDTDASTGRRVEADMSTPPSHYKATLHLQGQKWVMYERDLLGRDAT